jgi:hypothetical protein
MDVQTEKITIRLTKAEKDTLVGYCTAVGRNQSDIIREFIRKLKND